MSEVKVIDKKKEEVDKVETLNEENKKELSLEEEALNLIESKYDINKYPARNKIILRNDNIELEFTTSSLGAVRYEKTTGKDLFYVLDGFDVNGARFMDFLQIVYAFAETEDTLEQYSSNFNLIEIIGLTSIIMQESFGKDLSEEAKKK